jgi:phosphate transport system substrate-binding protein
VKNKFILLVFLTICTLEGYTKPRWEITDRSNIIDEDINFNQYLPFDENSKIARLNERSTLRFIDDLPYLDGATALYPLYSVFANAVYPTLEQNRPVVFMENPYIQCSKTIKAYENLINGKVDIIFCAAPSDEQIRMAEEKGVKFNFTPIGKEAFVFFVNTSNPITDLTYDQVCDIYSGRVTNWKELGGEDDIIIAYQRPKNSGSQTILEAIMGNNIIIEPPKENVIPGMGGIFEEVASYRNYENAIGYSFLFFSTNMVKNEKIKILSINGITPSIDTIKSGKYPLTQMFYAIKNKNESENVNKFINWILSEQGKYLIEHTGYVPIN